MRVKFIFIILFTGFLCLSNNSFAVENLKTIREQIKNERTQLDKLTNSKADTVAKLALIKSTLKTNKRLLRVVDDEIYASNKKLNQISADIDIINKKIYKSRRAINRSNIFLIDNLGYADAMILANAKSSEDVIMILEILSHATKNLVKNVAMLNQDIIELNDFRQSEEESRRILSANQRIREESLAESVALNQRYDKALKVLQNDLTAQEEYISQLKFKQLELEKLLKHNASEKKLLPSNTRKDYDDGSFFYRSKGRMNLPLDGKILEKFGNQLIEDVGIMFFNKGIKIEATKTSSIYAPYAGKIIFADSLSGFLNLVVINHDKNYYTVYGNLNRLKVSVGDNILQGDVIAMIDVADTDDSSYLYFELRKGEEALNPLNWFK